jgi:hypothetical protein
MLGNPSEHALARRQGQIGLVGVKLIRQVIKGAVLVDVFLHDGEVYNLLLRKSIKLFKSC